jgi:phenylacetate-coenzyme A ligase PaaK-like adenylate-forming protein
MQRAEKTRAQDPSDRQSKSANEVAAALLNNPEACLDSSADRMHGIDRASLEAIQLRALQERFEQFHHHIPMLEKLAKEVGVDEIRKIDDVVPILFKHTVYKSYPVSFVEKSRFPQMMQWLNKLTIFDLSTVDVARCQSIDEWISTLDAQTPLGVVYSSGTSGTMSFIPRFKEEGERMFLAYTAAIFRAFNLTPPTRDAPLAMYVILPTYRSGAPMWARANDFRVKYVCGGDESKAFALYPGRVCADILFLAGRLRAAQQKGSLERLEMSPQLLARKAEFEIGQQRGPADLQAFFDRVICELGGKQIVLQGPSSTLYKLAMALSERGMKDAFSPDSVVVAAGGAKGQVIPQDWEEKVRRSFGVDRLVHIYGMSEVQGANLLCEHNRYHVEPTNILFLLDPDTGDTLPRSGVQTGRAAFYDLLASTYWGGFITGDELTVDWSSPCPCGKQSPHIAAKIERYSEKRGGDDKISCAAASDAHDSALNYLVGASG